jgi:hypothetical protein
LNWGYKTDIMTSQLSLEGAINRLTETYACARRFVLYKGILQDPVVKAWLDLIGVLLTSKSCPEHSFLPVWLSG